MQLPDGRLIVVAGTRERSSSGRSRDLLTCDEVRRLMTACSARASTGLRNRALITVIYRGGLRVAELIALTATQVDRDNQLIRIGRSTNRVVALDATSYHIVETWITRRRELQIAWSAPLFCTLQGGRLSPSYVRALFTRLGAKASIHKRVSAEVLRRTLAAELAREGVPIGLIQSQLGHQSATTTERYISRIAPDSLVETMRQRDNWLS